MNSPVTIVDPTELDELISAPELLTSPLLDIKSPLLDSSGTLPGDVTGSSSSSPMMFNVPVETEGSIEPLERD